MSVLICFGDSITAGVQNRKEAVLTAKLAEKIDDYEIINAGISGNNTADALIRIQEDVLIKLPDLVTVLFGANDAAFHKMIELSTYQTNLRKIVELIVREGMPKQENFQEEDEFERRMRIPLFFILSCEK